MIYGIIKYSRRVGRDWKVFYMHRPIYLLPFIIVYKIVFGILKLIVNICRYFYVGLKTIISSIMKIIVLPFKILFKSKKKKNKKAKSLDINEIDLKKFNSLRKLKEKEIKKIKEKDRLKEIKNKKGASKNNQKEDKKALKQAKKNDVYINENVKGPDLFANSVNSFFKKIANIPHAIKEKFSNNEFVKHSKNRDMMKREALLIDFDGKDAEKSEKKVLYEYVAKNKEGKIVKDYFEAFSKVEVHSFLLSEGYEVYSIKTNRWIQLMHKNTNVNNTKFKNKDLIFLLTQLSTYIKAGIPLVEALKILEKQYKNKKYKRILTSIIYDLTMGENFSEALLKQNVAFPKLLINMVKTAEMTGELPEVLDDQAEYYTQVEKIRKQMVSAMLYPAIVLTASIGVAIFIMLYVVPQFVEIYNSMDASSIPRFTLIVLGISNFMKQYVWLILAVIAIVVVVFILMYKNVKGFRTIIQYLLMRLPIIGNTIIYNEVAMFTKTFSSLLSHNVFITDSMEVLNKITNNEIYKMIILDTISNLAKGDKISEAFKDNWAFPIPAYEMLVTGEKTGELPEMMAKVSSYYQDLHAESVQRIKTVAEPAITVFLTVIVGVLIMAIIVPMFSMYSAVQNM